jgi:hypothetical protein
MRLTLKSTSFATVTKARESGNFGAQNWIAFGLRYVRGKQSEAFAGAKFADHCSNVALIGIDGTV